MKTGSHVRYLLFKEGELPYSTTFIKTLLTELGDEADLLIGEPPMMQLQMANSSTSLMHRYRVMFLWGARKLRNKFLRVDEGVVDGRKPDRAAAQPVYIEELKRLQPAVLLAQFGPNGVRMMYPCQAAGIPLITFFRGYDLTKESILDKYAAGYRELFRTGEAFITVSRSLRHKLIQLGAPPESVFVSPSGADCTLFKPVDWCVSPFTFLAVSRFTEKKGPQLTIQAFAAVHQRFPDTMLRMIGDGDLLPECARLVDALGLKASVQFLGAVPHEQVKEEMTRANVFVQHSRTAPDGDEEGTPVTLMEAGATGLPVVSTYHAGIPDLVIDGVTGLLVEENDVEGMAGSMMRLVEDEDLRDRLGKAAAARVRFYFDAAKLSLRVRAIADWVLEDSILKPELVPTWLEIK